MRTAAAVAILGFQLAMIVYARFVPSRYFCWAPFDVQSEYWVTTTVNGGPLSPVRSAPDTAARNR